MDINLMLSYFSEYGLIFLFIIVLLEYLNLPGFPAGIILPGAGILAANSNINFFTALTISVIAGLIGSWVLYGVGRVGGHVFLNKYINKFPSQEKMINKNLKLLQDKGSIGVFLSKLLPAIRTIISIPAGVVKLDFIKYTISSVLGILIWNSAFMVVGYYFGDKFI